MQSKSTKRPSAVIVNCSPDEREHTFLDHCWNCAPYWYLIPTCPVHGSKLRASGFCRSCRRYYSIPRVLR